jgi:hypothetical protein
VAAARLALGGVRWRPLPQLGATCRQPIDASWRQFQNGSIRRWPKWRNGDVLLRLANRWCTWTDGHGHVLRLHTDTRVSAASGYAVWTRTQRGGRFQSNNLLATISDNTMAEFYFFSFSAHWPHHPPVKRNKNPPAGANFRLLMEMFLFHSTRLSEEKKCEMLSFHSLLSTRFLSKSQRFLGTSYSVATRLATNVSTFPRNFQRFHIEIIPRYNGEHCKKKKKKKIHRP